MTEAGASVCLILATALFTGEFACYKIAKNVNSTLGFVKRNRHFCSRGN